MSQMPLSRGPRFASGLDTGTTGAIGASALALFLSTFVNRIDRKGRVSVPAPFRTVLAAQTFPGVIAFPSFVVSAIEASGIDRIERLSAGIDQFDPFSDEHDAFAISILADSHQLLPDLLREHGGITDQVRICSLAARRDVSDLGARGIPGISGGCPETGS